MPLCHIFGLVWEKHVLKPKSVVSSGLNSKSRVLSDLKLPFDICGRPGPNLDQNVFQKAQFEHFGGLCRHSYSQSGIIYLHFAGLGGPDPEGT